MITTKDTVPWRLRQGTQETSGALTEDQIDRLCREHDFDPDLVRALSQKLDDALSIRLNLSKPDMAPQRSAKGASEAAKAVKALRAAERELGKAREGIQPLRFRNEFAHAGVPNPSIWHLENFSNGIEAIEAFRRFLEVMIRQNGVSVSGVPDKRLLRDDRRVMVCTAIFNIWEEVGLPLGYTTDPLTSERRGALFDFANTVVELITDPPSRLSGETLRMELDDYRAYAEAHRPLGQV
jgi:hypothetical protein